MPHAMAQLSYKSRHETWRDKKELILGILVWEVVIYKTLVLKGLK